MLQRFGRLVRRTSESVEELAGKEIPPDAAAKREPEYYLEDGFVEMLRQRGFDVPDGFKLKRRRGIRPTVIKHASSELASVTLRGNTVRGIELVVAPVVSGEKAFGITLIQDKPKELRLRGHEALTKIAGFGGLPEHELSRDDAQGEITARIPKGIPMQLDAAVLPRLNRNYYLTRPAKESFNLTQHPTTWVYSQTSTIHTLQVPLNYAYTPHGSRTYYATGEYSAEYHQGKWRTKHHNILPFYCCADGGNYTLLAKGLPVKIPRWIRTKFHKEMEAHLNEHVRPVALLRIASTTPSSALSLAGDEPAASNRSLS